MKFTARIFSLGLAGAVLAVAAAMCIVPPHKEAFYRPPVALDQWLPAPPSGWAAEDRPIADSEEMKQAVDELLNFSQGIFRVYKAGDKQLAVYVAYWEPGKMDPRLVAVHSPDVCWVAGGWMPTTAPAEWNLRAPGGREIGPVELRTFTHGGMVQNVVFWHLVGGKPSGYAGRSARGHSFWGSYDFLRNPRAPRMEQWFVRISSPQPLTEFAGTELWGKLLDTVSLAARQQQSTGGAEH